MAGAVLLATFAVLRGLNGFGNVLLYRADGSVAQWLHVSKYPPSLTYDGLELGIGALLLAALFRITAKRPGFAAPVRALGQVALFYYLLHIHLVMVVAEVTGLRGKFGPGGAFCGAAFALLALAPACAWYRKYKAANPGGWRQYV